MRLATVVALLAPFAAGSAAAAANAPAAIRAFELGTRELEFERHAEAAAAFRDAIQLDGTESSKPVSRPSGMNFEPYLPHLGLGVALCEAGDLPGAVGSFLESDRQGAAQASPSGSRLPARRARCTERRRPEVEAWASQRIRSSRDALRLPPPPGVEVEAAALRSELAALEERGANDGFESWVARGEAAERIAAAWGRLRTAPAAAVPLQEREPASGVEELRSRIEELWRSAMAQGASPVAAGWRSDLAAAREALAALAERRSEISRDETARGMRAMTERVDRLARELPDQRLPERLLAAAQALFDGDPSAAAVALEGFDSPRPRSRAQAHLLRAAAAFARLAIDGDANGERKRLAADERDRALAADPSLAPDPRFFSRAFLDFFAIGKLVASPIELRAR